jgi:hypothetical protein
MAILDMAKTSKYKWAIIDRMADVGAPGYIVSRHATYDAAMRAAGKRTARYAIIEVPEDGI